MNGAAGSMTIALSSLGNNAAQRAFAAAGGKLPTGLQPEGYAIRCTKTADTKTWWIGTSQEFKGTCYWDDVAVIDQN